MTPDFDGFLIAGMALSVLMLAFLDWRFGTLRTVVFVVTAGLFPAMMDFL